MLAVALHSPRKRARSRKRRAGARRSVGDVFSQCSLCIVSLPFLSLSLFVCSLLHVTGLNVTSRKKNVSYFEKLYYLVSFRASRRERCPCLRILEFTYDLSADAWVSHCNFADWYWKSATTSCHVEPSVRVAINLLYKCTPMTLRNYIIIYHVIYYLFFFFYPLLFSLFLSLSFSFSFFLIAQKNSSLSDKVIWSISRNIETCIWI